jgi:hypothetical protein
VESVSSRKCAKRQKALLRIIAEIENDPSLLTHTHTPLLHSRHNCHVSQDERLIKCCTVPTGLSEQEYRGDEMEVSLLLPRVCEP